MIRKLKKTFRALLLMVLLLIAFSAGKTLGVFADTSAINEPGTWSIFLYLCGSDLETKTGAAGKNLEELLVEDIPDNINVVVQTGGAKKWRYPDIPSDRLNRYIVKDGRLILLESLSNASMGRKAVFRDFLSYGVTNYPAEKMCVIIWDHGSGSIDGVANDENFSFNALTLPEIRGALETVSGNMADQFELFGFDACLMANLETASMLEPYARYMVASEEIEPSNGWDYKALLAAIASDNTISGGELGKAICDGYYAKCKESGKESSATLSVTDLQKLPALSAAFESLAAEMVKYTAQPAGIQTIVQSANHTQKFGGASSDEGFSNLFDLRHFSENAVDIPGSQDLVKILDQAVTYKVVGSQKSKAGGLSFYYPLHPDENRLNYYCEQSAVSESYKTYLKAVYDNIPETPIVFTDLGSAREDGSFGIRLDENSRHYILSIEFLLLEYTKERQDGIQKIDATWIGQDNDCFGDWETLDFHSNFRGVWPTLGGCRLFVTPVESTEAYTIFTAPILLNGNRTNLRFAFIWDNNYKNGGYYKILGAWDGIDPVTGMSDKEITELKDTDIIQTFYYSQTLTADADGLEISSGTDEKLQAVPTGRYEITEEPLEESNYAYQFIVTDLFGNQYYSYLAHMEMTKTSQELKERPLDDGEYAAVPTDITKTTSPIAQK